MRTVNTGIGTAEMDFHKGEVIMHLAGTYPTIMKILLEEVQNSIDSGATKIDLRINYQNRTIAVRDNGEGVSRDQFYRALATVGKSMKNAGKLGQFGLGLISPIGKCEKFTFTSCPASGDGYIEWTLDTAKIRAQSHQLVIPERERPDLRFNQGGIWWRTEVVIYNFTMDKILSKTTVNSIKQSILDRYSPVMRSNKITIYVEYTDEKGNVSERIPVRGDNFTGTPLPVVTIQDNGGTTTFRMYIAKRSAKEDKKRVNIVFGETGNNFRFPWSNFSRSGARDQLDSEIIEALGRGILEGEIITNAAKLQASRTSFEGGEGLLCLCCHIEEWYTKHGGAKHLRNQERQRAEERYQQIGVKSLQSVEKLLKERNPNILKALRGAFKIGTIGTGHANVANSKHNGTQATKALAVNGGAGRPHSKNGNGHTNGHTNGHREYEGHVPLSVQGPDGDTRRLVKGNSIGLQLAYSHGADDDVTDLWQLDRNTGVLTFNVAHPLWSMCTKDWMLNALHEKIIMMALLLETMPCPEAHDHMRLYADEYLNLSIPWMVASDAMVVRARSKGKKQAKQEVATE